MQTARRIAALPPYLFAEIDKRVAAAKAAGVDVISFGVGDPDRPTPGFIVEELARAARDPSTHQYPSYFGLPELREAIAGFYERRFGVKLDPTTQVLPLIGSKEGIAHLATAFVDPGDPVLIPEPGYPVYEIGTILSGGQPVQIPMSAAEGWYPDFSKVDGAVADQAKILWLNYPSNPTAAVATLDQFERAVRFSADHDLLRAHDNAYSEITYDGFVAPSILEVPGALDVAVEFGSLSKIFNMTGWRIGWVVGSEVVIEALGRVKTNIDSGVFNAVQRAAVAALDSGMPHLPELVATYQRRRDRIMEVFWDAGWRVDAPKGALYIWLPTPPGESSVAFTARLLEEAGIVVAPGTGYGPSGEGFIRLSLTIPDARLEEGCHGIGAERRDVGLRVEIGQVRLQRHLPRPAELGGPHGKPVRRGGRIVAAGVRVVGSGLVVGRACRDQSVLLRGSPGLLAVGDVPPRREGPARAQDAAELRHRAVRVDPVPGLRIGDEVDAVIAERQRVAVTTDHVHARTRCRQLGQHALRGLDGHHATPPVTELPRRDPRARPHVRHQRPVQSAPRQLGQPLVQLRRIPGSCRRVHAGHRAEHSRHRHADPFTVPFFTPIC